MTQPYLFDFLEAGAGKLAISSRLLRGDRGRARPKPLAIDPYRGCGLTSCYGAGARPGIVAALGRILDSNRAAGRELVLGSGADPYRAPEAELGLTRRILELLARRSGLTVNLRTASPLLARDLDLLRRVTRANRLLVAVPMMSRDDRWLAALEPEAPSAVERLELLRFARRSGLEAGLWIAPVVPGLNDSLGDLEELMRSARGCGARFVDWSPLVLEAAGREAGRRRLPCPTRHLLERLRPLAPQLAERLERTRLVRGPAHSFCGRLVATRMRELKLKYGFGNPDGTSSPVRHAGSGRSPASRPAGALQ